MGRFRRVDARPRQRRRPLELRPGQRQLPRVPGRRARAAAARARTRAGRAVRGRRSGMRWSRGSRPTAGYRLHHRGGQAAARTLIWAAGVRDRWPDFPGVRRLVGKRLFWCIVCDGWRTRGRRVLVLGNTEKDVGTALQFLTYTRDLTFVVDRPRYNARCRRKLEEAGIAIRRGRVKRVAAGENGHRARGALDDRLRAAPGLHLQPLRQRAAHGAAARPARGADPWRATCASTTRTDQPADLLRRRRRERQTRPPGGRGGARRRGGRDVGEPRPLPAAAASSRLARHSAARRVLASGPPCPSSTPRSTPSRASSTSLRRRVPRRRSPRPANAIQRAADSLGRHAPSTPLDSDGERALALARMALDRVRRVVGAARPRPSWHEALARPALRSDRGARRSPAARRPDVEVDSEIPDAHPAKSAIEAAVTGAFAGVRGRWRVSIIVQPAARWWGIRVAGRVDLLDGHARGAATSRRRVPVRPRARSGPARADAVRPAAPPPPPRLEGNQRRRERFSGRRATERRPATAAPAGLRRAHPCIRRSRPRGPLARAEGLQVRGAWKGRVGVPVAPGQRTAHGASARALAGSMPEHGGLRQERDRRLARSTDSVRTACRRSGPPSRARSARASSISSCARSQPAAGRDHRLVAPGAPRPGPRAAVTRARAIAMLRLGFFARVAGDAGAGDDHRRLGHGVARSRHRHRALRSGERPSLRRAASGATRFPATKRPWACLPGYPLSRVSCSDLLRFRVRRKGDCVNGNDRRRPAAQPRENQAGKPLSRWARRGTAAA